MTDFKQLWIFWTEFHGSQPVSNFTEIRPVGAAPVLGDRRTDGRAYMTKRIGTFCDCSNAPENRQNVSYFRSNTDIETGKRYPKVHASRRAVRQCVEIWIDFPCTVVASLYLATKYGATGVWSHCLMQLLKRLRHCHHGWFDYAVKLGLVFDFNEFGH